jgi:hypothetical protein
MRNESVSDAMACAQALAISHLLTTLETSICNLHPKTLLELFRIGALPTQEFDERVEDRAGVLPLHRGKLRAVADLIRGVPGAWDSLMQTAIYLQHLWSPDFRARIDSEQNAHQKKNEHYPYISYGGRRFVGTLGRAGLLEGKHFLDVGCGIADKVMLAWTFGTFVTASGLEYDRKTVGLAKSAAWNFDGHSPKKAVLQILEGDALEFDKYGKYDVIYMYMPMRDPGRVGCLLKQICEQASIGTRIVEVMRGVCLKRTKDGFKRRYVHDVTVTEWQSVNCGEIIDRVYHNDHMEH